MRHLFDERLKAVSRTKFTEINAFCCGGGGASRSIASLRESYMSLQMASISKAAWRFAEKLHAYVSSYADAHSTRVKDLVDLVLLSHMGIELDPATLRGAIDATFAARKTSIIPLELPPPPEHWHTTYTILSEGLDIPRDIVIAHRQVAAMLQGALRFRLRDDL